MDRRSFLKVLGGGALATAAVAAGCDHPNEVVAEGFELGEVPTDKMTYRENSHGDKVSLLGFGCMRLPTIAGESGREEDQELDQDRINEMFDYAIAHGVNLFDTAPPYCKGRSEHAVGVALSRHSRDEYFISTKLSNMKCTTWSREASIEMFENSLRELQVDYVDYLMLHCMGLSGRDEEGNELSPMETFKRRFIENGMLDYLLEQRKNGRIRNLGFSYHGDVKVFDYLLSLHKKIHWDHVLIQHNYLNWQHAHEVSGEDANSEYLYGELEKRNIPVFVMEPLLGGQLASLYDDAVDQMKRREPSRSVASWAFRFAANQPRILTVLSGMTYMEHLQDNIRTYSPMNPLNEDELKMLAGIANTYVTFPTVPCTGCKYCMPCPYGLDIPGIFAHYNKCLNEGDLIVVNDSTDEDSKAYRKARRAFLVGYDRSVPNLRQADHCISCGKCVTECPQGIEIPVQLARINEYVENLKMGEL